MIRSIRACRLSRWPAVVCLLLPGHAALRAGPLEDYLKQPDASYAWKKLETLHKDGFTIDHLELTSQTWRGRPWTHDLQVVYPKKVRNPGIAFLLIAGDGNGSGHWNTIKPIVERAGAVAAVLTRVPNQPLFENLREDALIAYTFDQCLKTGDDTWPLLLPMTKSAVRAMDAVQDWARKEHQQKIGKFVVSGASKRGWTTWLTGAADPRVCGIAPMVIDMLHMKAQANWAQKVYGKQSERIHDYTERGLIGKMDTPPMIKLCDVVDPYSYRNRFSMAKLLLLGTNDPYWTVDSLRHYWNALPEPKHVFQAPNTGHNAGGTPDATQTLAAFFQMLADGEELPRLEWTMTGQDRPGVTATFNRPARKAVLWTATSSTRDFRNAQWTSTDLSLRPGAKEISATVETPATGYRAFLAELLFPTSTGHEYKLSTQVQVTPDSIK